MEKIYKKSYLKNFNYASCYGNNNKSIIKFSNEKVALLLFNNFQNGIHFKKEKFIILINNKNELNLFNKILSSDYDEIKNEIYKNNSNIIIFENYIEISESSFNDIQNINQKYDFKNEIQKLFILIFYYERFLLKNLEKSFRNKNEQYFLINHEYLFNLKKFFNYEECFEQKLNGLDHVINYINLDNYMDILSRNTFIENDNKLEKSNFDFFKNNNKMKYPIYQKFQFNYFSHAFILPSKIYNIIKNLFAENREESNIPIKILYKEGDLLIFFDNTLEIGYLNEYLLFIPKYIFIFNNKKRLEIELETILNNSIEAYLKYRKCFVKSIEPQSFFNSNMKKIGIFFQLNNEGKNQNMELKSDKEKKNNQIIYTKVNPLDNSNKKSKAKTPGKSLKARTKNNKNNQKDINSNSGLTEHILNNIKNNKISNVHKTQIINQKNLSQTNIEIEDFVEEEGFKKISNSKDNYEDKIQKETNNLMENNEINNLNDEKDEKINDEEKINLYIKQIETLQKENIKIKNKNNQLENEVTELKVKIEEFKNEQKENNDNIKKNQEENLKIKLLNEQLKKESKENIELNNKIKEENENLKKENEKLKIEIETNKIKYEKLLKNIEQIKKNDKKDDMAKYLEINKNNPENGELDQLRKDEKQLFEAFENNIILSFDEPTLIGLNNIGATCFMNATLQCLSQTDDLTNYFLKKNNLKRIIHNNIASQDETAIQLSPKYLELIEELWSLNGKKSYSPYNFRNTVEMMNPLFQEGKPGDSKDFIIFILEQLHKELKKPVKQNIYNNSEINQPLNQYDKTNAFNHFFEEFLKETSVISDIFFGISETRNECQNCKAIYNRQGKEGPICYNYQIFNCLIFPLEEVKKMKYQNYNYQTPMNNYQTPMNNYQTPMNNFQTPMNNFQTPMNNYQTPMDNKVNIYECFEYYQRRELFSGQNQNYCNKCQKLNDSLYTTKIYVSPNVLILILNRGKGNIYDVKLIFNEIINISNYAILKDSPNLIYSLYGVITHIGQSGPSAHFIASCKSPVDQKWYRYNDAIISPISNDNIQKEIIDFGTPYILFYQKVNNNA